MELVRPEFRTVECCVIHKKFYWCPVTPPCYSAFAKLFHTQSRRGEPEIQLVCRLSRRHLVPVPNGSQMKVVAIHSDESFIAEVLGDVVRIGWRPVTSTATIALMRSGRSRVASKPVGPEAECRTQAEGPAFSRSLTKSCT